LRKVKNSTLRVLLLITGSIFLGLGIAGLLLPVLPGSVFLVLAAVCFIRSSEKMYYGLINHKFLGKFVKDYSEKGVISLKLKLIAIFTLIMPIVSYFIINTFRH
jgi:uncharacterized protein